MTPTTSTKFSLIILSVCFMAASVLHVVDIAHGGWLPYRFAPDFVNLFWSSLAVLDGLAAVLLWTKRRRGLALALAIMLTDVTVNTSMAYGLELPLSTVPLLLQSAFLGFALGCVLFLWNDTSAPRYTNEAGPA